MSALELSARPIIAASWHRATQYGLNPGVTIDSSSIADIDRQGRLMNAAGPVLDHLTLALEGTGFVVVLADRESKVMDLRYGTHRVHSLMDRLGMVEGRSVQEEAIGTNSIATAMEVGRGIAVHGDEHFIEALKRFSCYGQPIYHPITRRLEGVLNITCLTKDATTLLAPFVRRAADEIEARLLSGARAGEQQLLGALQSVVLRDRSVPAVALSRDIFLANEPAVELLHTADHALLRGLAVDVVRTGAVQRLQLSSGREVSLTMDQVAGGALFTFELTQSRPVVSVPSATRTLVAVCGEPGSGCTRKASDLMADVDGEVRRFDGADVVATGEREWLSSVEACLSGAVPVIIEAVHLMPQPIARRIAVAMRHTGSRVVLTSAPVDRLRDEAASLIAQCVDRIDLAPLRTRREDIPSLVADLLSEHGASRELRFTPGALESLIGQPWPGNLRELESVVREVVRTRKVGDVGVHDLPEQYRNRARSRLLTPMEQAERDAIVQALRTTGGNKRDAALHLGISRTTLYRALRTYGIVAPVSKS